MFSAYTILGLDENAPQSNVDAAYKRLRMQLDQKKFASGSLAEKQCAQCLFSIENAYKTLSIPKLQSQYRDQWKQEFKSDSSGEIQPKLGQLCVAAGMITLEELEKAIESQTKIDLPLGQILQDRQLITQAELDGLLLGQKLIHLPADSVYGIGQRLMALGLVSEDMVRIALIVARTFGKTINEILIANNWLDPAINEILLQPIAV